jgi:hydrogenase nickel incorporation protein HypA/HybF
MKIELEIGDFAGIEIPYLERAFEILKQGTVAQHADLAIYRMPLLLYCPNCDNEYAADVADLLCPACDGEEFDIVSGREMIIKSITGDQNAP